MQRIVCNIAMPFLSGVAIGFSFWSIIYGDLFKAVACGGVAALLLYAKQRLKRIFTNQ